MRQECGPEQGQRYASPNTTVEGAVVSGPRQYSSPLGPWRQVTKDYFGSKVIKKDITKSQDFYCQARTGGVFRVLKSLDRLVLLAEPVETAL